MQFDSRTIKHRRVHNIYIYIYIYILCTEEACTEEATEMAATWTEEATEMAVKYLQNKKMCS